MRTNHRLAQLWLDALATELGASAGTIATYTDDLNCYLAWLDENSLGLDDVGLEQIRDYIASLDQRGYAGSTMARRITVARGLHKFLIAEELGSRDPTANLSAMQRSRKLPFVLSIAETEALLETAHRLAADPSVGLYRQAGYARRAALFETLYASGMRISEALSLPSDAAPPGTRMLLVRGKGDKQRLVPLHDRAIAAIAQWQKLASAYSGGAPSPWLFHSVRNGSQGADAPGGPARDQGGCRGGRACESGAGVAARAAPCLCHPHAFRRHRPARAAGAARPCRHRDHPDLHPSRHLPPPPDGPRPPPAERE